MTSLWSGRSRFFGSGGAPLDPDAEAFLDRWNTPPSASVEEAVNALFLTWKAENIYVLLQQVVIPVGQSNILDADFNWLDDDLPATQVGAGVGAGGWVEGQGWVNTGPGPYYIDTGFAPNTGTVFLQNSASFGVLLTAGADAATESANHGTTGLNGTTIIPRGVSDVARMTVNNTAAMSSANGASPSRLGLKAVNRSASNACQFYNNGVQVFTGANNSGGRDTDNIFVLASNSDGAAGGFCLNTCAGYWIGGSLTGPQHLAMYNAMQTYVDAVTP